MVREKKKVLKHDHEDDTDSGSAKSEGAKLAEQTVGEAVGISDSMLKKNMFGSQLQSPQ